MKLTNEEISTLTEVIKLLNNLSEDEMHENELEKMDQITLLSLSLLRDIIIVLNDFIEDAIHENNLEKMEQLTTLTSKLAIMLISHHK